MGKVKTNQPTKKTPNKHSPPSPAKLYIWEEGVKRTSVYVKGDVGNLKQFYACDLKKKKKITLKCTVKFIHEELWPREVG